MSQRQPKSPSPSASTKRRRSQPPAPLQASPVAEAPSAESPTAPPSPSPDLTNFDATEVITLEELVAYYGPASDEDVDTYLEGAMKEDLAKEGAKVATERITRDATRIYGIATDFRKRATPDQEERLPAITDHFMRVAVWSAYQGQQALAARKAWSAGVKMWRSARAASNKDAKRLGAARRDVLRTGLLILAGQKKGMVGRIKKVYRRSTRPATLAAVLRDLVALGREMLEDTSLGARQRRRDSRLTADFLTECEAMAERVATVGEAAEAVPAQSPVTQGTLDLWDGRNLIFLRHIMAAFEAGHALDPVIPRLRPNSLRGVLSRAPRKNKAAPKRPPETP
ncbi:MAG TPA: hypothetical protein VH877_34310 [Polyangia bacterium]|nr:hypothetical protein [Polyangia bacterium]